MSAERERLRAVVAHLEAIDRERASVMRERDRALVVGQGCRRVVGGYAGGYWDESYCCF